MIVRTLNTTLIRGAPETVGSANNASTHKVEVSIRRAFAFICVRIEDLIILAPQTGLCFWVPYMWPGAKFAFPRLILEIVGRADTSLGVSIKDVGFRAAFVSFKQFLVGDEGQYF